MTYVLVMHPPNRIRELRKQVGISQTELGLLVGLTQGQVGHLENGHRNLTLEWMRRIAKALGVDVGTLLTDEDNRDRLADDEREVVNAYRMAEPEARWYAQQSLEAILSRPRKRSA